MNTDLMVALQSGAAVNLGELISARRLAAQRARNEARRLEALQSEAEVQRQVENTVESDCDLLAA